MARYFQHKLEKQTAKTVPILNLARDCYGALQIFDQTAKLIRTGYRPTALMVAITRADLLKARTWRMTINTWQLSGSFHEHQAVTRFVLPPCLDCAPFSMVATHFPNGRPLTGPSDPALLLGGDG